jgi:hypothetical protein
MQIRLPTYERGDITCLELADLSTRTNRIALYAYLQGFYDLAWQTTAKEIQVLSNSACSCARICEVQPRINLVRLSRVMMRPLRLKMAIGGLAASLDRALAVDPHCVPVDLSVSLLDESFIRSARQVGALETAKLKWLLGEFSACEELTRNVAQDSGVAMELTVRSLIELGRIDQAIGLATAFSQKFGWLSEYAVIALLRGGAYKEAIIVLESIRGEYALPLLRVAIELADAGFPSDAAAVGCRLAEASISAQKEVPALMAAAFLMANGYDVLQTMRDAVMRVASTSRHYPSVVLVNLILAAWKGDADATHLIDEGMQWLHRKSLPPSMQCTVRSMRCRASDAQDRLHHDSRISQSRDMTSTAAAHTLSVMATHK